MATIKERKIKISKKFPAKTPLKTFLFIKHLDRCFPPHIFLLVFFSRLKMSIPYPQDVATIVKNRAIQELCSWATNNAAWLCGESGSTRGYVNVTKLKFDKVLLEQAGWTCEERKLSGKYRCGYELIVFAKLQSFHKHCHVCDVGVVSPCTIWKTLEAKCAKKLQQSMKDEDVQDQLFIDGKNVTFAYDTEKEAEVAKDVLESNGWTIILSEKIVTVWSPLHKSPFLE